MADVLLVRMEQTKQNDFQWSCGECGMFKFQYRNDILVLACYRF